MRVDLVIWADAIVPNACLLGDHSELGREWELTKGVSRAASFPEQATWSMHPDYPYDTLLTDNLMNNDRWVVVSSALAKFLQKRALVEVEYLPIAILDHRGRAASQDPYVIVHPTAPVDALDLAASGARFSDIDTSRIKRLTSLVIDPARLDPNRELFKLKHYYKVILVARTLAQAITTAGFTGIRWIELDKYRD